MPDMARHVERRAVAFQELHALAHNPPITFDGAPPELGYDKWIDELQSALSRYRRTVEWEKRAHAETSKQGPEGVGVRVSIGEVGAS